MNEVSYEFIDPGVEKRLIRGYDEKYHWKMGKRDNIPECCISEFIHQVKDGSWLLNRINRGCLEYLGGPIWVKVEGEWRFNQHAFSRKCNCIFEEYILCNQCHQDFLITES